MKNYLHAQNFGIAHISRSESSKGTAYAVVLDEWISIPIANIWSVSFFKDHTRTGLGPVGKLIRLVDSERTGLFVVFVW